MEGDRTLPTLAAILIVVIALVGAGICYHLFWVERTATTAKSMPLWPERAQAAGYDRTTPTGRVAEGETVDVLWTRYGKDYWACYIRTQSGSKGWVLCTDL
jgi:hypothetical protein